MKTTFEEIDGDFGQGYYVVRAAFGEDFKREWWLAFYPDFGGWQISEFTHLPSRHGHADEFRA